MITKGDPEVITGSFGLDETFLHKLFQIKT